MTKKVVLISLLFFLIIGVLNAQTPKYPGLNLDQFLSKEEWKNIGIEKLNDQEREALRILLIERVALAYTEGIKKGKENVVVVEKEKTTPAKPEIIESQIDGDFEGWEGETIVKLINGQIWQQTEYHYKYHYSFMPKVLIYKSGASFKMKVDGIDKAVGVVQLK